MSAGTLTQAKTPTLQLRRSRERGFEDFGWTDNGITFSFASYHMSLNTDADIYPGRFAPGDTAEHLLQAGRGAWVNVVSGEVTIAGVTLDQDDGVGIIRTDRLNFTFEADS